MVDGREPRHSQRVPLRAEERQFLEYTRTYTDSPFLIELVKDGDAWKAGQLLRAGRLDRYTEEENSEWKFLNWGPAAATARRCPWAVLGIAGELTRESGTSSRRTARRQRD